MAANIPPAYTGSKNPRTQPDPNSTKGKIRALAAGEYVTLPLQKRSSVGWIAAQLGYKLATRQMGSPDTFRCYRVE